MVSCKKYTNFTEGDLKWVDVYEENDTLVFQEPISTIKDTTIILKKEIYRASYQPIAREALIPHTAKIWYWNKKYSDNKVPEAMLMEMYKDNNKPASPWINYLGFSFDVSTKALEPSKVELSNGKIFNQVYILDEVKKASHQKETQPYKLYWDKKYGIIKYETYGGEVWERINW